MNGETDSGYLPGSNSQAVHCTATLVEQRQMARDTYCMRLQCPEIARQILPGQFFMIRDFNSNDPLLGRPFALFDIYYDESGEPAGIDFGYLVVGKLTSLMPDWQPGDQVEIWGPLGNGFPPPTDGHLMMVAGGIGQTPFLAVAHEALGIRRYGNLPRELENLPAKVSMCYGVRSSEFLAGLSEFEIEGLDFQVATDDGSAGHHGFVTELLEQSLQSSEKPDAIYCCGPEPMMRAVADLSQKHETPCWLSLETPMACGFGACFSCVTPVREADGEWDYRRVCVEGPVFPAEQLIL